MYQINNLYTKHFANIPNLSNLVCIYTSWQHCSGASGPVPLLSVDTAIQVVIDFEISAFAGCRCRVTHAKVQQRWAIEMITIRCQAKFFICEIFWLHAICALGLPDNLKYFQGHFVFQRGTVGYIHGRPQKGWIGHFPPAMGQRTQNLQKI